MVFSKHTGYLLFWSIFLLSSVETLDVFTPVQNSNNSESALIHTQASTEPDSSVTSPALPVQQEPDRAPSPESSQPTDSIGHQVSVTQQPLDRQVDVTRPEASQNSTSSTTGSKHENTDVTTTQVPDLNSSTSDHGENHSQPLVTGPGPSSGHNFTLSVQTTLPGVPISSLSPGSVTSGTGQASETPSSTPSSHEPATTSLGSTTHSHSWNTAPFSSTIGPVSTNMSTSTTGPVSAKESTSASSNSTSTESTTAIDSLSTDNNISTTIAFFTTANSTNSSGIVIPKIPKRNNVFPSSTTTFTTMPNQDKDKDRAKGDGIVPCSTNRRGGLVNMCLIAIATLAGFATIFMVSTIILCTKLSSRKRMYKTRDRQRGTEMVCISALMPEINREVLGRSRIHKGVRGFLNHSELDSDDDGGDDLTLHSFLPDNDRVV